ncbi:MAG: hypothetical protein IKA51_05000 [Clostridia bacterium]|nr:hypothetical protein [Clostridia bacterium]
MNHLSNLNVDPMKFAKSISDENNKTIKEFFKDKINGSFLIKIKSEVFNKMALDLFNYYPFQFDNKKILTGTDETPEYDICRIIVGVHRHHSIFFSEQEIRENQRNAAYQEQLVNEVIEKIRLRHFGSVFFRRKQLLLGDEFLYFPVPYELFVMCMRSICLISENVSSFFIEYGDILKNALSSLTLMENNFLSNAYPLCRGMIEQYLRVLILKKHPKNYKDYERFCNFEIEQSCCSQKYPDEFIELFDKRILSSSKSKVDYLHYGWLDNIESYDTKSTNRYSIYGIMDYLMAEADDEQYSILNHIKSLYKMCHGYTHGSAVHVRYPLLQYFEISIMLYHVITTVFNDIYQTLNIDFVPEDKMLIENLERDFSILYGQYKKRSTENFDLYYGIHHK